MKKIFVFSAILFFCFFSGAERVASAYDNDRNHPIDLEFQKRMDADSSTVGMIEASVYAEEEWDKLLNKNYAALMKKLSKAQQGKLRASQREWIKYRDLEFDFNSSFWSGFDGTMYRVFPYSFRSDFVRERALQLGQYLEESDLE